MQNAKGKSDQTFHSGCNVSSFVTKAKSAPLSLRSCTTGGTDGGVWRNARMATCTCSCGDAVLGVASTSTGTSNCGALGDPVGSDVSVMRHAPLGLMLRTATRKVALGA